MSLPFASVVVASMIVAIIIKVLWEFELNNAKRNIDL